MSILEKSRQEKNLNSLELSNLVFYIGVLDSPGNKGLPLHLPFTLEFDRGTGLIVQKYSKENERFIIEAYNIGSLLSVNLGQGSFGVTRAEDILKHLLPICHLPLQQASFLEVGCADGYLLHRLKLLGANKVLGCEPGPMDKEGEEKFNVKIINSFFNPELFNEKFDIIFSYGVLEHLNRPIEYIKAFKTCLREGGKIFIAVPNCEKKLKLGDVNILAHEHWNYFTAESLKGVLLKSGLADVEAAIGRNDAMIYAWGGNSCPQAKIPETADKTEELFCTFSAKINHLLSLVQKRIGQLEEEGKSLGMYAGGVKTLSLIKRRMEPRFFDGDIAKHGKYFPGCKNAIEAPSNLIQNGVDELWVMALDYEPEIIEYLKNDLKVPDVVRIIPFRDFLEA